ncbi:hypothetical protein H072_4748 [Dactylellina haptotyla CBS 200.50]|uniref:DNA repair metallo-beta-lactamase domain-containing protein n=1 Tax=Dactylellina haptotyla (strain CBS 200.50) TaxID=1284197 RepID=S8AEN1_DACHA|nr:hypothetical protein H072_4748 [Dactylellina haptotyla CBS 200.50]
MPLPAKRKTPSTSTPSKTPAKRPSTSALGSKGRPGANGNILNFFKKVDGPAPPGKNPNGNHDLRKFGFTKGPRPARVGALGVDLFYADGDDDEDGSNPGDSPRKNSEYRTWQDDDMTDLFGPPGTQQREILEAEEIDDNSDESDEDQLPPIRACTPPPPLSTEVVPENNLCPFSFDDPVEEPAGPGDISTASVSNTNDFGPSGPFMLEEEELPNIPAHPPQTLPSETDYGLNDDDFIEDEGMENFDEEQDRRWKDAEDDDIDDEGEEVGEEKLNRKFMEQEELDEAAFLASLGPIDEGEGERKCTVSCPICDVDLAGYKDDIVSRHVNCCLDGKPIPLPPRDIKPAVALGEKSPEKAPLHPPRPAQSNPFAHPSVNTRTPSAFSKIMASNAEDRAWKEAAEEETRSRGKRSFQRTCPFYKILPNLNVAVDAFRYGAVEGTNAYFLSHFHSDHYIGLSSSWSHGPIYCSRVTANLCRRQLRVDPQYIKELEYEKKTQIPGTGGATVTMIDANHCPGSSLFLFEKMIPSPRGTRFQRILHCGDFRASAKHLRHPLLSVAKKNKIDICYLDTTYLNPKYAFPPQRQVIDACMELCVSLDREVEEGKELGFGESRKEGGGIEKFTVAKAPTADDLTSGNNNNNYNNNSESADDKGEEGSRTKTKTKGRLLVVVGTYSIGKERICMGIARALNCKIYAPANKQRICAALEDQELNSRLTSDPHAAQVHMTPLMEIRPETLRDYLASFKQRFTKVVGFRPSGWNYRPPNSRFVESPQVQTVLHSQAWRSDYGVAQMVPQRGSTAEVKCFGVPYSEHSSFRELTAFCCALDIVRVIPTVNVGSAKSREKMKMWFEKWAAEKKKNGFYVLEEGRDVL